MTMPDLDGCPWPVDPACLTDEWETNYVDPVKARAIALAGNTLRRLTGYQVGGCPVTVRPCGAPRSLIGWPNYSPWRPLNWNGEWSNACGCRDLCRHRSKRVELEAPNGGVEQVKLDGVALVADVDYWVDGLDV